MIITTEKAFDALPYAVEIYDKLGMDNYIKKTRKDNKGKKVDTTQVGIDLFKHVLKNLNKVKLEVFSLLATIDEKTADEIKEQSLPETIKRLKELLNDDELLGFFKSAMQ